jgi:hypothetical protein
MGSVSLVTVMGPSRNGYPRSVHHPLVIERTTQSENHEPEVHRQNRTRKPL